MYNVFGIPRQIILNSEGEQYDLLYVHDQESYSAKWLRNNGELEDTKIYTGTVGGCRLKSQGGIRGYDSRSLFEKDKKIDGYIYLRYSNIMNGELIGRHNKVYNMTDYQDFFLKENKIYNNGGAEVWK